jgi:putative ABC transport system permease protein
MLSRVRSLGRRVRSLFARDGLDERLRTEMELHALLLAERHERRGLAPEDARRQARLALGSVDQAREQLRDRIGFRLLEDLASDLRLAWRQLRRSPGFAVIAVVTLALGVGVNTAVFSLVNGVLLRPLPFRDAERLVTVFERDKTFQPNILQPDRNALMSTSVPGLLDWRSQKGVFEEVGAYGWFSRRLALTGLGEPEEALVSQVTANFFTTLGVEPMLGRGFPSDSDQAGRDDRIVLGHALWQRRFHADPGVIGRTMTAGGRAYTVVGVMPPGFQFPRGEQAWVPYVVPASPPSDSRSSRNLQVIARLRRGASAAQAQAVLEKLASVRAREFPAWQGKWTAAVIPLREHLVGNTRQRLLLLFGATGFVVLIACANLANMLLARGTVRTREMALRVALGASRFRLLRQIMAETLLLAVLGGATGIAIAVYWTRALAAMAGEILPQLADVRPDWRVLLFALGSAVTAGLLAGVVPSLRASRADVNQGLKEGITAPGGSRATRRLGGLLVAGELAAALVLLAGAGLMVHTLARLGSVNLGFRPDNLLTMRITFPPYKYLLPTRRPDIARINAVVDQAVRGIDALPGVQSVGLTDALPFSGVQRGTNLEVDGRPGQKFLTHTRCVAAEYFETMGIPLVRGRLFAEGDTATAPKVAIVNQALARQLWPGEDPIGKRVTWDAPLEVVGVVGEVRHLRLDLPGGPEIYVPTAQYRGGSALFLAVRTSLDPATMVAAVRREVWAIDKDQPIEDVRTMEERIAGSGSPRRFYALLLGVFAAIAVLLAAVGVYGIMSYAVSQRTHEIGIRVALGARRGQVLALVLRHGVLVTAGGLGIGLAGALAATRLLTTLLYDVAPTDPLTFASVALGLAVVALIACYIPACRAANVDPLVALRRE